MGRIANVGATFFLLVVNNLVSAVNAKYTPLSIDLSGYKYVSSSIDNKTEKYLYSQESSQSDLAFGSGEVAKSKSEAYIKNLYLQGLDKFFTPSSWLKKGEDKVINGTTWYDFQYVSNPMPNSKCCDLFHYHLMTIYKNRLVTFAYSCPVSEMDKNRAAVQTLVKSLMFKK